jgi:hypothetical protein
MMTPKEKAEDLFNKFKSFGFASLCVDEILNTLKRDSDFTNTYEQAKRYWEDVKKEIRSL